MSWPHISSHKKKKIHKKLQIVRIDASDKEEVNKFANDEFIFDDTPSVYVIKSGIHYRIEFDYPLQLDSVLQ